MKKLILLSIVFLCTLSNLKAQTLADSTSSNKDTILAKVDKSLVATTKNINELKTGQANDVITNFYQLAIKNIFGKKKEVSYKSTIFGLLDSINHGKYEIDTFYRKTRWARNIELSLTSKIDTNSKITGFGGGVKFYLLNKRDITNKYDDLNKKMSKYEMDLVTDMVTATKKVGQSKRFKLIQASKVKYYSTRNVNDLDPELLDTLKHMHSNVVFGKGLAAIANDYFMEQIKNLKQKPQWSLAGYYYHSVNTKSDTLTIQSDFLVGLGKSTHYPWEFTATSYLQLYTNQVPQSESSKKFHFEGGVNKVLTETSDGKSNMELKGFGSFDKEFNTLDNSNTFKANITYRYLVSAFSGFWLPITLSYDPAKGKLLGFIDLTFNIDPKK